MTTSPNILVVGDAMLDRYWFGDTDRISPEAPVPVVRVKRIEDRLGGAANVALNVRSIGAFVRLLSVVGKDEAGSRIAELIDRADIDRGLFFDEGIETTLKLRIVARQQQILRCDFEQTPTQEVLKAHLEDFSSSLSHADALLLSDYGKGGLTHIKKMIELAREKSVPVLIDPKGSDYERYRGATVITPNRAELKEVVGAWNSEEELHAKAQELRRRINIDYLLLTRSEEGMTLFSDSGAYSVPAQAREVYDVSGAGDTVIAVMAVMLARGFDAAEAVRYANKAGGIVVGKLGTATVSSEELFN